MSIYQSSVNTEKLFKKAYDVPYIKKESCNADQYLRDCSYEVNLEMLYTMHSSCSYHKDMFFMPVQMKINDSIKKFYEGCSFLLQVWDRNGKKAFELALEKEVKQWAICFNFFVFKTQEGDKMSDYIQIVELENGNYLNQAVIQVQDFINDDEYTKVAFANELLYMANKDYIKIVHINTKLGPGEKKKVEIKEEDIAVIDLLDLNIHALTLTARALKQNFVFAWIEMPDNQISMHALRVKGIKGVQNAPKNNSIQEDGSQEVSWTFDEQKEIIQDTIIEVDPIKKVRFAYNGEQVHSLVQKKSGKVDVYFNGIRRDSSQIAFRDVEVSFDTSYIQQTDGHTIGIPTSYKAKMSIDNGKVIPGFRFRNIFNEQMKESCKFITGYNLIETHLFVSHGKIVTQFSVIGLEFKVFTHYKFDCDIETSFRMEHDVPGKHMIGIIHNDCTVNVLHSMTPKRAPSWKIIGDLKSKLVGDRIITISRDFKNYNFPMFMTRVLGQTHEEDAGTHISCMHFGKPYDITEKLVAMDLPANKRNHKMVGLFETSQGRSTFIYHQDTVLTQIHVTFDKQKQDINLQKIKQWKIPEESGKQDFFSGLIDETHLTLIGKKDVYKFDLQADNEQASIVIHDLNWQGIWVTQDLKYGYTMNHKSQTNHIDSGLKYYDMKDFRQQQSQQTFNDKSYHLENAQVGKQAFIDYSVTSKRLTYIFNFEIIKIMPLLHRNSSVLMGQQKYDKYLCFKVTKDFFAGFTNLNMMQTWNILKNKKATEDINIKQKYNLDFSDWELWTCNDSPNLYRHGYYPFTLLRCKTEEKGILDSEFYSSDKITPCFKNQQTFNQNVKKSYHEGQVVEIMEDQTIKIHFKFVHPYYQGAMQKIFFNQDLSIMVERLTENRMYMYRRENVPGKEDYVKWVQIHRYSDFPQRIGSKDYMDVLCPDYSKYLDIRFDTESFVIKDAMTEKVIHEIPHYLMNFQGKLTFDNGKIHKKEPKDVFNRFKWVGNNKFRITSDDGIENLIDIDDGKFSQVEYRYLQNFDIEQSIKNQIFFGREAIDFDDTISRLKQKSSGYRAAQIFDDDENDAIGRISEGEDKKMQFYESLVTVDFITSIKEERFITDSSFAYLYWKLVEEMEEGTLRPENIDDEIVETICYNVFPNGDSFLTKLCRRQDVLEEFYERAQKQNEIDEERKLKYKIPMYNNFDDKNCFSLAMEHQDLKIMNIHLLYLQDYQLDHHSRMLYEFLPQLVTGELPNLPAYLSSRTKSTFQTKNITKGQINDLENGGIVSGKLWEQENLFKRLYKNSATEVEVKVHYIDIPKVYCLGQGICEDFFSALGQSEQLEIFDVTTVKKMIDFNWPSIQKVIVRKQVLPFTFQLLLFLLYGDYLIDIKQGEDFFILKQFVKAINSLIALYFLHSEGSQLVNEGIDYFSSMWNYFDIGAPLLILALALCDTFNTFNDPDNHLLQSTYAGMLGMTSFCLWIKWFYFLRIFKSTGFYIKTIIEVANDMKFFIVVLCIGMIAFGDALRRINTIDNQDPNGDGFIQGYISQNGTNFIDGFLYIFSQSLGNYDPTAGSYSWFISFVLINISAIFNCVIMMNLLIAVISESFTRVNDASHQASYREYAALIGENQYLLPQKLIDSVKTDEYLTYIVKLSEIDHEEDVEEKHESQIRVIMEEALQETNERVTALEQLVTSNQAKILDALKKD